MFTLGIFISSRKLYEYNYSVVTITQALSFICEYFPIAKEYFQYKIERRVSGNDLSAKLLGVISQSALREVINGSDLFSLCLRTFPLLHIFQFQLSHTTNSTPCHFMLQ